MEELKPCTKCGNKPELIWSNDVLFKYGTTAYAYRCPVCSISTGFSDSIIEAKKSWNKRPNSDKIN